VSKPVKIRRSLTAAAASLALLPLVLLGCPKESPTAGGDAGSAPSAKPSASSAASGDKAAPDGGEDEEVKPVYAIDPSAPPDPVAQKLCTALSEQQEKKRTECCNQPQGIVLTSQCVGLLGAALKAKALAVDEAKVQPCIAALEKTFGTCDWVGPFPPPVPEECHGLLVGKVPSGQRCRSNLECEGTLRCHGVGPTTPGRCGPPREDGEACGGTDVLVSYTQETRVDQLHPACKHKCVRGRCTAAAPDGDKCMTTVDCAEGSQCVDKKCVKRAPSKAGEACPGEVCESGYECILGKCGKRKAAGEACTQDFECVAGCVKAAGAKAGKCGMRCDKR